MYSRNATLLAAWADSKIGNPGDGATTEDPRNLGLLDAVWESAGADEDDTEPQTENPVGWRQVPTAVQP